MKQNLLNKLWLRVTVLVALMTTALAGTAMADTKTFDFKFETIGTTGWSNSYAAHSYEYTEGTVKFIAASKQTQNISTMPVTKGQPVEFIMKDGYTISAATFVCQQWTTKTQTITLHYSTDGGENYISTGVTSSNFTISSDELPSGTNAVKITFDSQNNQIGIKNLTLTYDYSGGSGDDQGVATSVVISDKAITNTDVHVSDEAGSLSATVVAGETTLSGATVTWSGDNDAVATIDATGAVTLVGAGVVTFTAAYAGVSGKYKPSSATYEMTVTDNTPFTGGDVTFDAKADKGNTTQGAGSIVKNGVTFYCSNGILGNGSEYRIYKNSVTTFTLSADAVASGYVIKSIAFTCTGSNPASGFADQEGWTTNVSDGTWTGAATSVSFTASNAQVRATEIVVTVGQQAALASIELSGDYPTTFHVGDDFSHEGIVVTANYEDQTTKDVTASAEFTGYNMAAKGAQTVTVSYTEGEVTKTATYDITVNAPATLVSISLSGTYPTEFGQGDAFSSEGIVVTANYDDQSTKNVTEDATFTGYDMDVLGEQTVTVSYEGKEATYTITVVEKKGTATNPYTVAEARAAIDAGTGVTGVYATGIVSKIVTAYNSQYGNISYNISADGTEAADQLQAFRGKSYNGEDFTSADDIQVGDVVVIYGNLKKYNSTYEFDQNNQLVSLDRPVVTTPSINLGDNVINAFAEGTDGFILVDYKNITNVVAEVFFCDADGNAATYDWITASINDINKLEYIIDVNESTDARTAYMKVHALDDENNDVYSELITINQAGVTVDYATLPFAWEGSADEGKSSLEKMNGVTANGLGSDYATSNAPYRVKLDGTGDYIQVQTDCQPVLVSLDVKMLGGGSSSTITVQESADGETFTDVEELNIEGAQNTILYLQTANAFDAATRYVRLYFTKGSNVGLGGIAIEKEFDVATVGEAGYATYVTKHNVSFPKEVEAYIATSTGYDQIKEEEYVSLTKVTSVAKGTPVVLKNEGEFTLDPVADPESAEGNLLKASDGTVEGSSSIFVLAKPANKEVGFYAVQEGTTVAEGKAYLEVAKPGVKGFVFAFADQADGINEVNGQWSTVNGQSIFNLAGQRIQKMQKGINIVNGKKVVLK